MSGISPTSSATSTILPNNGLSSVGASLLTTGVAPDPASTLDSKAPVSSTISKYQADYLSLQQYDTQELLYASFLSPSAALANADSVFSQAAQLLDPPAPGSTAQSSSSTSTSTSASTSASSSTTSATDPLASLPSVSSILAGSDQEAQQTLSAYANAPVGSSIIDYQA